LSLVLVDDDDDRGDDDDRYHVHRKHAFNEAIECKGERESEERKKDGDEGKESTGKGEWVLTECDGLFLYSLALQGWFIDKVMVP